MSSPAQLDRPKFVVDGVKERSPGTCILWGVLTGGLYAFYWFFITGKEMKDEGVDVPTGFLMLVPGVNLWWWWRWCKGCETYTNGYLKASTALIFLLLVPGLQMIGILLPGQPKGTGWVIYYVVFGILTLTCISIPILQSSLNKFRKQHLLDAFE